MSAEIETLHVPFLSFLDGLKPGVEYTYHRPDRPTGSTLGDPDVFIFSRNSVLFIELKDKETRISKSQTDRHAVIEAAGCHVHICRSLEHAQTLVTQWRDSIGQVPERTPVAQRKRLCRLGGFIYEDGPTGYVQLRKATADDVGIPGL